MQVGDVLRANAEQMSQFVAFLFPYADPESYISLRAFDQKDRGKPPLSLEAVQLKDSKKLLSSACRIAEISANSVFPAVFAPPVATFSNAQKARHVDIANGVALSVEIDAGDTKAARAKLEHILGPVTICMESGSQWSDPNTGETFPKIHLHWRLSEPTRCLADHDRLREARWCAAILVGGDTTAAPPSHPLRWPGSWNTKNEPRLAIITAGNQAAEIHLADAIEKLQDAVEAAGLGIPPNAEREPGAPQADLPLVSQALTTVPNQDLHWEDWNRIGMAMYAATGGRTEGLTAWSDWSAKSRKHEEKACKVRWQHYGRSPPSRIGAGTIFHLAKTAGWVRPSPNEPEAPPDPPGYMDSFVEELTSRMARERRARAEPVEESRRETKNEKGEPIFQLTWFNEITPVVEALDFVQGTLGEQGSSVVYGRSNAGKTFFATDLALSVAAGRPWFGKRVDQGPVVYCVLEGSMAFNNRVVAWAEKRGLDDSSLPFVAIKSSMNLLDPDADTAELVRSINHVSQKLGQVVKLVVIDTLARALAGGNENASEDMGALIRNMDAIRLHTGAHVLFIHHCGKDEARGARGHSSLVAAIDTEIEVVADDASPTKTATVVKQRDMKKGDVFEFTLNVVEIAKNRHDEMVTTCVVVPNGTAAGGASIPGQRPLSGHTKRALEILNDVIAASGRAGDKGVPPSIMSVPEDWWRERFYERAMPGAERKTKEKAYRRAADLLVEIHRVGMANERIWVIPPRRFGAITQQETSHGDIEDENGDI